MSVQLKVAHLDLGIVTDNGDSMSHFYGTIIGFPEIQELPLPGIGRLKKYAVGESIIKIMILNESPKIAAKKKRAFAAPLATVTVQSTSTTSMTLLEPANWRDAR